MCPCPYMHQAKPQQWHDAKLDFAESMSYGDYLGLDKVLDAQVPRSQQHNEMLFIIQHQASELWMKLLLHELRHARQLIDQGQLAGSHRVLARVLRIMEQMVSSWAILATLSPMEFISFRSDLGNASGFQSYQYREIEFIFGNKNRAMLLPHQHTPQIAKNLEQCLHTPSLYDAIIQQMTRQDLPICALRLDADPCEPTRSDASVEAAWVQVYRQPERYWDLYQLGEKLMDIEDAFRQWRFRHVTVVERVIGFKKGTGGTEGVEYLRKMLGTVLFPELWSLRSSL